MGFDLIGTKLVKYKVMAMPFVQNILNLVVSGSMLECGGPQLWSDERLGPKYIVCAMIELFFVDYLNTIFPMP